MRVGSETKRPSLHRKNSRNAAAVDTSNMSGMIKPQSSSSGVEVSMPLAELEVRFEEYWQQVKDILSPDIVRVATKGGFREVSKKRAVAAGGGKSNFFQPVLVDVVDAYLQKQPRQALTFNSVTYVESNDTAIVKALVYLEPEVTWKIVPGVDEPLVVKMPKQPVTLAEDLVTEAVKRAQDESVVLVPLPSETTISDGQVVVLDCQSVIDGAPWDQGCFTNNKWPVDKKYFRQPDFYDALLGMKVGESKTISFNLASIFGADSGKSVAATIRINQAYSKDVPNVDDDLAMNYGFNTLDAWKTGIRTEITRRLENQRASLLDVNIMAEIVNERVVDVEVIPYAWMVEKAKEIYGTLRQQTKSETELLNRFIGTSTASGEQVTNKATLMTFLAEKSAQSLIHDLVLRSWGRKAGVEGDSTLSNIDTYVTAVKQKLNVIIKIEEYETQTQVPVNTEKKE